jgi:hypothetical protein
VPLEDLFGRVLARYDTRCEQPSPFRSFCRNPFGGRRGAREIALSDPVGVNAITKVMLSANTRVVVFN